MQLHIRGQSTHVLDVELSDTIDTIKVSNTVMEESKYQVLTN